MSNTHAAVVYRRGESPAETVLSELCTMFGFCLKPDDRAAMLDMPTDDLDAWTKEVFEREGLAEPFDKKLWLQMRGHVERRLGQRT